MALRKWFGALVAAGLVGSIAVGCSSSNSAAPSDGGSSDGHKIFDSGITNGDDGPGTVATFDGTTGKRCAMDSDCQTPTGAMQNVCSNGLTFTATGVANTTPFATPVCMLPPGLLSASGGDCDPVPNGTDDGLPHFCDGPDDPTSPGICVPFDASNPQPNEGFCYPKCTFALDGAKPTGCVGTDSCGPYTFVRTIASGAVTGYGVCGGGCGTDADCAPLGTGFACQTDVGYCTMAKLPRKKALGAACTTGAGGTPDDNTTGACNCDADPATGNGFCSSSCVVGGLPCPGGWTCDAGFQNPLVFTSAAGGASFSVPVTSQNVGLTGTCRPACVLADGGAVDSGSAPGLDAGEDGGGDAAAPIPTEAGSGACPPNSTCKDSDVVGPTCLP